MTSVHHDAAVDDDDRRAALYRGDIFLTTPDDATRAFCTFARQLVEEAFAGLDPETAQEHMPVGRYVDILSTLKPRFIHHPRSKELLRTILERRGCDLGQTYFDVPRLRTSTSGGYLTSGIAYAWHPHRDTWYSAPLGQLNFWMAVYPIEAGNAMAFHQDYFATAIPNTSSTYNYYEWNSKHRAAASSNVGSDARPLPGPTVDVDLRNPLVFVTPVGGLIEFSGQHLHSSVPNQSGRTRFSIDFRTVHIGDIKAGRTAPNVDASCSGSSIRDFIRASDFSPMPERIVELFNDGTEARGELVFSHEG
ncbi:MAG TPA: hypothetical protein VE623_11835 [Acidimicrobiales bacterium]|nr:hypothetical protein [Acidimicrobiales bacterium]